MARETRSHEEQFSLQHLEVLGTHVDAGNSFELPNEVDAEGKKLPGEAAWVRLLSGERSAEGKLYLPQKNNGELVIFNPGLPGDAVTRFETRYIPKLLNLNYVALSMRHSGLRVGEGAAPGKYVRSDELNENAKQNNRGFIGDKFSLEGCGHEVLTALQALQAQFKRVHFVGHSMGAINTLSSLGHLLEEDPKLAAKIGNFISIAGAVGPYDMELGRKILEYVDSQGYYVGDKTVDENVAGWQGNEQFIRHVDWSKFPKMQTMFVSATKLLGGKVDEYVAPEAAGGMAEEMYKKGGKNINVVQYANRHVGEQNPGEEAHDLDRLNPQFFVRWITGERQKKIGITEE
jgi:pimeloyl-ACP methyl ester carboxylesterase